MCAWLCVSPSPKSHVYWPSPLPLQKSSQSSLRRCLPGYNPQLGSNKIFHFFFFPDKALLGPLLQQGGARTNNRFPCLLTPLRESSEGWTFSLYGVRVGVYPGVGPEGWPRCFAHLLGVVVCRGMRSTLPLLLTPCFCSRLFKSGSSVFWSLWIFCPGFALTVHACSYF